MNLTRRHFLQSSTVATAAFTAAPFIRAADPGKKLRTALIGSGELAIAPASPDGFKPTARAQVLGGKCWTAPVLANGRIYCRNGRGDVVCVNARKQ